MQYISNYKSLLGEITIASDDMGITGLWFVGQKYFELNLEKENEYKETKFIRQAKKWLDIYFNGKNPNFEIPLHFTGTDFQNEVWQILYKIPYGQTTTYGEIAKILAKRKSINRMSAQAVGRAVGHNQISLIVPCHRVVGTNGSLIGYAGGIEKKAELLKLEQKEQKKSKEEYKYDNNQENDSEDSIINTYKK